MIYNDAESTPAVEPGNSRCSCDNNIWRAIRAASVPATLHAYVSFSLRNTPQCCTLAYFAFEPDYRILHCMVPLSRHLLLQRSLWSRFSPPCMVFAAPPSPHDHIIWCLFSSVVLRGKSVSGVSISAPHYTISFDSKEQQVR